MTTTSIRGAVPEPVDGVPEPVEGVPEPVEGVPEPVDGVPEPVDGVPEPVEGRAGGRRVSPAKTHRATPGQTVGPFFAYGLEYPKQHEVVFPHSPGAIVLGGTVYDGAGAPVPDALVEIFGADADGSVPRARGAFRRDDHTFTGFGRAFTDDEGHFAFWTREPGGIRGRAAFFAAIVFARGLPDKLHTRIYVPGDEAVLAADSLLSTLTSQERATLIATREAGGHLRHDIRLQGEKETVFLAF